MAPRQNRAAFPAVAKAPCVRACGIGILPLIHGLEGDPQRGILRRGPQAHAAFAGRMPATRKGGTPSPLRLCHTVSALPKWRVEIALWVVYILPEHSFRDKMEMVCDAHPTDL